MAGFARPYLAAVIERSQGWEDLAVVGACILYWIHATSRVFEAICLRFVILGLRVTTQNPTGGAAWRIAR